jgi:hypothetical protein
VAKQVTVPLNVTLREETFAALTSGIRDVQPTDVLRRRAEQVLETMAGGGLVLTPDHVKEIEGNSKKPVQSGRDVVLATESPAQRIDGGLSIQLRLDPAWEEALKTLAESSGRTVDMLIFDMWDIALENQWCYSITPKYPPVYLDTETYELVQKITDVERPNTNQIRTALKRLISQAKRKSRSEEPEPEVAPERKRCQRESVVGGGLFLYSRNKEMRSLR